MYGVGKIMFRDFVVGYIKKDSFDLGGKAPEVAKVYAEQIPGEAVLVIPQSNGSVAPSFALIQLDYTNLHKLLGGTLHYAVDDTDKTKPIGWTAQSKILQLKGPWRIDLVSGQSILIANALLLANLGGKLTLKETAEVACSLALEQPDNDGDAFGTFDTESIPDTWTESYIIPKEEVPDNTQEEVLDNTQEG